MTYSQALRDTLDELGLTVAQAARKVEVTEGAIYKQLAGAEPTRRVYDRMRRAFPPLAKRMDEAAEAVA